MTLDPNYPKDTEKVSMLPYWIRQVVAAIVGASIEYNALILATGATSIIGSATAIEVIYLTANSLAEVSPTTLTNGDDGRIKLIVFGDSLITLLHNAGNMLLKGDPALPDFPATSGDVIGFVWDTSNSKWTEIFRALA